VSPFEQTHTLLSLIVFVAMNSSISNQTKSVVTTINLKQTTLQSPRHRRYQADHYNITPVRV